MLNNKLGFFWYMKITCFPQSKVFKNVLFWFQYRNSGNMYNKIDTIAIISNISKRYPALFTV